MTTAPERRTATLTELVAQEIDSVRGRRRMSQAQLARAMGKTPMWVSLRLRGIQAIDLNDLQLFARTLGVGVLDLMPAAASRQAGRTSGTADLNDSSGHVAPSAEGRPVVNGQPTVRQRRHVVTGTGPLGAMRRDSTRPVSAVPFSKRRPTRTASGNRPITD
jgi:transcriptional regulator with XRE-family HTH domain